MGAFGWDYPPGVTGNEPAITGEYPCAECGATLPEYRTCPRCDGSGREAYTYPDERATDRACTECDGEKVIPFDGDTCPDGCPEDPRDDWDAHRDAMAEQAAEDA